MWLRPIATSSFSHRSSKSWLKDLSYSAKHESWAVAPIRICTSSWAATTLVGSNVGARKSVTFQGLQATTKRTFTGYTDRRQQQFTFHVEPGIDGGRALRVFG